MSIQTETPEVRMDNFLVPVTTPVVIPTVLGPMATREAQATAAAQAASSSPSRARSESWAYIVFSIAMIALDMPLVAAGLLWWTKALAFVVATSLVGALAASLSIDRSADRAQYLRRRRALIWFHFVVLTASLAAVIFASS